MVHLLLGVDEEHSQAWGRGTTSTSLRPTQGTGNPPWTLQSLLRPRISCQALQCWHLGFAFCCWLLTCLVSLLLVAHVTTALFHRDA